MSVFFDWLVANGGTVSPKICIHDYSETGQGKGVKGLENIKKNEILFTVPRRLLLNHKNSKFKNDLSKKLPKTGWARIMWSVALESLCKDTIWRPYFDIVPARFNLPISWNAEDRELFAGTEIADMIGDPEADFKSQFLPFASQFDLTAGLSEERLRELYFYSGSLVSSYSFTDEDGQISMVPLADILNHKTGFHNASLFFERNHLQMVAIKNVPAGSQLYNTYGDLGNEELLFRYGYIDDPNPFTVVKIPIEQFCSFAIKHLCEHHNPEAFKSSAVNRLIEKGSIREVVELASEPTVCRDLLDWFNKLYSRQSQAESKLPIAAYFGCVSQLLHLKLDSYIHVGRTSSNPNQRIALDLVDQEVTIIKRYIDLINCSK